jgi:hypothetical protein
VIFYFPFWCSFGCILMFLFTFKTIKNLVDFKCLYNVLVEWKCIWVILVICCPWLISKECVVLVPCWKWKLKTLYCSFYINFLKNLVDFKGLYNDLVEWKCIWAIFIICCPWLISSECVVSMPC